MVHTPTDKTRAEVSALASFGIPQDEIAAFIKVAPKTLRKYYPDELELSAMKANAQVGKFLYEMASGQAMQRGATYADCSRSAMFWAKTRMGWREVDRHEHSGPDGAPIKTEETGSGAAKLAQVLEAIAERKAQQ